jgi:GPH family glycoside/pentoside/hexuronide:cation symporter
MSTLRNPLFVPYVVSQLLFWIAFRIIIGALTKMVEVRADVGETKQGVVIATALLVAAVLFPFMPRVAKRLGKKRILMGALVYFGFVMIPIVFLGRLPLPLSAFGQGVLIMALAGPPVAALFTLPNAMVADIVDRDEQETGQRREAIYFGVQGLILKAGMGIGVGVAALELGHFGETAARQGGFTACALTAMVLAWAGAAVLTRYRGN